jgi:acetyltransferase-like isoleucine patch superfamily enzyme
MSNYTPAMVLGALSNRLRRCSYFLWGLEARFRGVTFEGKCEFQGRPIISVVKGGRIVIGDGVRIASAVRNNMLGLFQPSVLRALSPGAQLILGRGVGVSGTALCAGAGIEIGEQTIIGAGAMIIDNDFHLPTGEWGWSDDFRSSARPIKIGRGVFIGARAIVLKGVTIGDRAVVGAGALVTKDVPAHHVAVGNPARVFQPKAGSGS